MRLAIQCFEDAIKLDPRYALAHAGLADCYGILAGHAWMLPKDARPPAYAAVTQAMTLAPSLWEVNFSRGFYECSFEPTWREAEPYFQKAILINPRSSLARAYYGLFLATDGRAEEAVAQTTLACRLDALSPFIHRFTSMALYNLTRFDEAERMARHALELQPGYCPGLWAHGKALCALGRNEEAIDTLERAVAALPAPLSLGLLGLVYARAGRLDDTVRLMHELENRSSRGEYVPTRALLPIYVGQGDLAAIREALSNILAEGSPPFVFRSTSSPFLEAYRSDPEIDGLLSKLYGQ
jgi:tetratricopeptide (TPR) repeat protein